MPRVDIPADWVDFVVQAPTPYFIEPLFTRDPAQITEIQVLMAMMAIKGIYAEYGVQRAEPRHRLRHRGDRAAAADLRRIARPEGQDLPHWALNPHPALIPAIEAGWVESVHSFGSELGMEDYIRARSDVFFTGRDGSLRSNRAFCQAAGHYACDLFIGSTLQIDLHGNQLDRHARPHRRLRRRAQHGRRRARPAPCERRLAEGRPRSARRPRRRTRHAARQKLVVQMVETFREHMQPAFVETLDAWTLADRPAWRCRRS